MAVVLNTEPTGSIFGANDCLPYNIGVDSVATSGTTKRIGYQLFSQDVGGANPLQRMKLKSRKVNSVSDFIEFDASKLLRSSVSTVIPNLDGSDSLIDDPSFVKEFYIEYTELVYDNGTGDVTGAPISTVPKKIINAYFNLYNQGPKGAALCLTDKRDVSVYPDTHDWIRCFGTFSITVTYYKLDGTTFVEVINGVDKLVPVGPAQLTVPANTYKYTLEFTTGEKILYRILPHVYNASDRIDVYYLEPKGTWSVMTFKGVPSETVNRDMVDICRSGACVQDVQTLMKSYGREIVIHRSWLSISLQKLDRTETDNIEQMRAFANARQYRAAFRGALSPNHQFLVPLILEGTSIPVSSKRDFFEHEFNAFYGIDLSYV